MRPFELALILNATLILIAFLIPRFREGRWRLLLIGLIGASAVLMTLHLLIEGYRWQMLPIFALIPINIALITRIRRALLISGAALLVAGLAGAVLLPVPRLPQPSGPYAIGTFTETWMDESRRGIYATDPDEPRTLSVQIWYPADAPNGRPLKWVDDGALFGRAMTEWVGLPLILLDQVGLIDTHTYADLPISAQQERYPVVIYSHGWGGTRSINQDQLEALASQGYIVISADHTYGALLATFADGRTVRYNPDALPEDLPDREEDLAGNKLIATFAADLRFMIDQLAALDSGTSAVSGHVDQDRIGLFGHSTGGGAVMLACSEDDRCKAVLGMDTWITPLGESFAESGLDQPAMLMNSEVWALERNRPRLETFYAALRGDKYWIVVRGSAHYDFAMVPLFSPLAVPLGMKGPIAGDRMVAINHAYLVAFFDHYLRDQPAALLGDASAYPEVIFEASH